jgi:hypothetical protein
VVVEPEPTKATNHYKATNIGIPEKLVKFGKTIKYADLAKIIRQDEINLIPGK